MIHTEIVVCSNYQGLRKVKQRLHSAARMHMNYYEWNKQWLQMKSVTKAESMTVAHVFPLEVRDLLITQTRFVSPHSIQSESVVHGTGLQINRAYN